MSRFNFDGFKPDAIDSGNVANVDVIDKVAARHGYVSREPVERIYKQDQAKEATVPLSIRPPLSVANRFIAWCKAERLSYWEGLQVLMDRAGI